MSRQDAMQRLKLIQENDSAFYNELDLLKKKLQNPKMINDTEGLQGLIKRMDERIDIIANELQSSELHEEQTSKIRIDEAIKEFKIKNGKINMDAINDVLLNYPMSLDKLAISYNYADSESFLSDIRRDPAFVSNMAIMKFGIEYEADELTLKNLQGEGRLGDNAQRLSNLLKAAERKVRASGNILKEEDDLFKASNDFPLYIKTLHHQDIVTIRTFILLMFIPRHFINELEQLKKDYDYENQLVEKEHEKFKNFEKEYKRRKDELDEEFNKKKKAKEIEEEELDSEINKKDKLAQELGNRIEDYNKTLSELKPQIEDMVKKHGKLLKDVEELEKRKEEAKARKKPKEEDEPP